jgi:Holliday junction resolvasome RuvABC DNA-binding subunit
VEAGGIGYLLICSESTTGELRILFEENRRDVLLYTTLIHRDEALDV